MQAVTLEVIVSIADVKITMTLDDDDSKASTSRRRRQRGHNEYAVDNVVMMGVGRSMTMFCELHYVWECRMLMTKQRV